MTPIHESEKKYPTFYQTLFIYIFLSWLCTVWLYDFKFEYSGGYTCLVNGTDDMWTTCESIAVTVRPGK